jgi:hypothetical protein
VVVQVYNGIDMVNTNIINVKNPINSQDVATKKLCRFS